MPFDWFKSEGEGVWMAVPPDNPWDPKGLMREGTLSGPFHLWVPKVGGRVRIYGIIGEMEQSQERFMAMMKAK